MQKSRQNIMAKPRKKKKRPQQPIEHVKKEVRHARYIPLRPNLTVVEDLRTFHPQEDQRDYRKIDGRPADYVTETTEPKDFAKVGQRYFRDSRKVTICKRRRRRREILFAKRKTGKGKKVSKKRKWTTKSNIRCT